MTTTTKTDASPSVTVTRLATYGVLAAIAAGAVNGLVRAVAVTLLNVPAGFGPLGWGPVVNTTVVGIVGATATYGLLARVSKRPDRTFRGVASLVLVLSFVPLLSPPAFLAGAPWTVLATLGAFHVTTAAVALGILPRAANGGEPR